MMNWAILATAGFGLFSFVTPSTAPPTSTAESAKVAVNRAIPLIQKSLAEYPHHASCFSCHHQGMGLFALRQAGDKGYSVDRKLIAEVMEHTAKDLRTDIALYQKGQGQPGGVTRAGYAMLALDCAGAKRDETTLAVTGFLLGKDKDQAFWRSSSNRPPSEVSAFTDTFLAIRAMKAFGDSGQRDASAARTEKAQKWLIEAPVKETEDRVFQLWALKESGATREVIEASAKALLADQRPDGGWAQLPAMESDAYATGSALSVLLLTGSVKRNDPAVGRAVQWLLKGQLTDGSWHVVSRSKPFQPYFESGFPHTKDQFISMAASCWAVVGLSLGG
ncbi:MAG: prenyltransferase/squalene oxidase repeat-containing protein [Chthonomonadales bacterium]